MRGVIRRICRLFGFTSLDVTHDEQEALYIADRIAILDAGKLLQVGTPADIYRRPRNRLVAEFIGEGNFLTGQIAARDEFLTIKVGDRSLRAAAPAGRALSPGSRVVMCLRPEAIRISENQPAGHAWRAKLLETTYLGQVAQHRFHCESDTLKVAELNPRPARVKPGNEYYLCVDPEEVTILGE
jgi:iron(III) transport system ATP-binding protein